LGYLNQTDATLTSGAINFRVVAHRGRNNLSANLAGSIQDGCSWLYLYLDIIYGYLYHCLVISGVD
jgi:hypothetical protein